MWAREIVSLPRREEKVAKKNASKNGMPSDRAVQKNNRLGGTKKTLLNPSICMTNWHL